MPLRLQQGKYFGYTTRIVEDEFIALTLTDYPENPLIENHCHENAYLSMTIRGGYIEKNRRSESEISPGQILYRPSSYTHANKFRRGRSLCFNIEFKNDLSNPELKFPKSYHSFDSTLWPGMNHILLSFIHSEDISDDCYIRFYEFLNNITECSSSLKNEGMPWVNKVIEILQDEYASQHSLSSLAKRVFVHPVYLSRAFKSKTGMTVFAYLKKIRLQRSFEQLLRDDSVYSSALDCGFYDSAHFCKSFKEEYRRSPFQALQSFRKLI